MLLLSLWKPLVGHIGTEGTRRTPVVRSSANQVVLTASRPPGNLGTIARVIGPGCEVPVFGRILGFDEFFGSVNIEGLPGLDDKIFLETVRYYFGGGEITEKQSVHGIQIYLKSKFKKSIVHTRGESMYDAFAVEGSEIGGEASVRVVTGEFAGYTSPESPADDFLTLDVRMRPKTDAVFPIDNSLGILLYVLEGAALIKHDRFSEPVVSYQNEGHGLWIPQLFSSKSRTKLVIETHPCSYLRFMLLVSKI